LLTQVGEQGSRTLTTEAKALFDKEDFKGAKDLLRKALALKADYVPARQMLQQAEERDTKKYFLDQGRDAVVAQKWDRAVQSYERALTYDPKNQDLLKLIGHVRTKSGQFYIRKATGLMDDGWLFRAIENFNLAAKYIDDPNDYQANKLRRDIVARANYAATQFKE
jgi:tetratricopeptide (TPR) repeat protein